MELLQLRYFLESAINENFSKTAEKYQVPPSSVSIAVKKLESELGCPLFTRHKNRVELNEQGMVLRRALQIALDEIDAAVARITTMPKQEAGDIRLLIRCQRGLVSEYVLAFQKRYPQVVFHLAHDFFTSDVSAYDIIIDEQPDRYQGFDRFPILSEKMLFAANKENPLCGKPLMLNQLYDQPFITLGENSSLKRLLQACCKKAGFRPRIVIESDDPYYIRKYVEQGLGIILIPELSWQRELGKNIAFLDVVDFKEKRVTYAYFNRGHNRSTIAKEFYRFLTADPQLR